ncbi:ABC transporter ATP-binding protein [Methylocapsa palsarum]|uniref:Putative ABC transport system ATP-binding protein n=1 Tax=Methylocapsa palsarum TaxID=1612308 RepID=A0A1I4B158_9HYPH|nr:ABC transporter ATP-binding protein [Methylocapsa palsarum]SFK61821.1 putative ABC transport system ATP-binding protein [Methylocapsa palsarum]
MTTDSPQGGAMTPPPAIAGSQPPAAIRCRGIVKEFGRGETLIRVLHGIDLDVRENEMTFIVGPSGCGKTTLISIIAGILSATAGAVDLFGTRVTSLKGSALVKFRRDNIGFIFQQFNLLPALSALENAAIPLIAQGASESVANAAARRFLIQLGLEKHLEKFPSQMSGGQQQRVAIARALVHEPRFIVCDEPTASLDAASGRAAIALLRDAAVRPGRAVIIVTHDSRIFDFADRMVAMSDGRIEKLSDAREIAAMEHH